MKRFKDFMSESSSQGALYLTVRNGQAQLRSTNSSGAFASFGRDVVMAILQGDVAVVTLKNGVTQTYRVNIDSRTVSGPVSSV